jgi:hypothetical protein
VDPGYLDPGLAAHNCGYYGAVRPADDHIHENLDQAVADLTMSLVAVKQNVSVHTLAVTESRVAAEIASLDLDTNRTVVQTLAAKTTEFAYLSDHKH